MDMTKDWWSDVLSSSIVGIIITLLISAIGFSIANGYEAKRWRRQQRLVSYTKLARLHTDIRQQLDYLLIFNVEFNPLDNYYRRNLGTKPDGSTLERFLELNTQVDELIGNLNGVTRELKIHEQESEIINSSKLHDIYKTYWGWHLKSTNQALDFEDTSHSLLQQEKTWVAFIDQAQRDLGLKRWWMKKP